MNSTVPKCKNCWKTEVLCVCNEIKPLSPKTKLLILQHPQEARNPFSTARMLSLAIPEAIHKVGLSYGSLKRSMGQEVVPSRWGVLYVGTKKQFRATKPFQVLDSKGKEVSQQSLEGIVVLDGNWKQSKTLWWRNSWLLRLNRVVLNVKRPSLLGEVRHQPRGECLCSLEAVAESFRHLEGTETVSEELLALLTSHVQKMKAFKGQSLQTKRSPLFAPLNH